jgi:hypothetical protein
MTVSVLRSELGVGSGIGGKHQKLMGIGTKQKTNNQDNDDPNGTVQQINKLINKPQCTELTWILTTRNPLATYNKQNATTSFVLAFKIYTTFR